MATTRAGAALTAAHRTAQLGILGSLLNLFEQEWSVDTPFSGAAFVAWLAEMAPEVAAAYALSAETAERYYEAFRRAEGVTDTPVRASVDPLDAVALRESLVRFGPGYVTALVDEGLTEDRASRRALVAIGLEATKMVMAGGRNSLAAHLNADDRARGWARVARANSCAFCAMLASRGPVYSTRRAAGDGRHWHPGCKCQVEPYFGGRYRLTPEARRYAELWKRVGTGRLADFRRALERPDLWERKQREQREQADQ